MTGHLKELCRKNGTTLASLGQKLGRSRQWMSELNRGNIRLTYETAEKIASVFNTTPDAIFLSNKSNKNVLDGRTAYDSTKISKV